MCFVSIVAMPKFISVVTDGLVTGVNGLPIKADYQKYSMLGEKQFVAFTGDTKIAEQYSSIVKEKFQNGDSLKQIAFDIQALLMKEIPFNDESGIIVNICLGGVSREGLIECYSLSNKVTSHNEIKSYISNPNGNGQVFLMISSVFPEEIDLMHTFEGILDDLPFISTLEHKISTAQIRLNGFVSANDKTVNNVTFSKTIYL